MAKASPCDLEKVGAFIRGELLDEHQSSFEQHLEACTTCREKLETLSAADNWWSEAKSFLSDDDIDSDPISELTSADANRFDRSVSERYVLESLTASEDPRMLGRIAGYDVAGVIGTGGMGVVLKGFDAALNRYVAIKVLAPHLAESAAARRRFAREAQAAAAVVHENVIAIHGVSEANGLPYLVMPYERSSSLQKRLDELGVLGLPEILRIAMQTAAGLSAAHQQGLVHRDIKPANLLLADGVERVAITDFGLARAVDDASLTRTGIIAGTPQYMSPEQAAGEPIDFRSDLFSLGSVIYTMSTGRPPFRADSSLGVLRKIAESSPRPIHEINPDIPAWLDRIVKQLHAKAPDDRFQTADEVSQLLEDCLAHIQHPTTVPLPRECGRSDPNRRFRIASLVLGVAVCMLLPFFWRTGGTGGDADPAAATVHEAMNPDNVPPNDADVDEPAMEWFDPIDAELSTIILENQQLESDVNQMFGDRLDEL